MYDLEVRIPVGMDESMWTRAAYIARAVREQVPNTKVRLSVGYPQRKEPEGKYVRRRFLGQELDCYYLGHREYMSWYHSNNQHAATIMERFKAPFESKNVIFLDADVFPTGSDIMQPFRGFEADMTIAGSVAHAAPFENSLRGWQRLSGGFFKDRNKIASNLYCTYTGANIMAQSEGLAPPYFNTGVVYANADYLCEIEGDLFRAMEFLRTAVNSYFVDQIALTLAMLSHRKLPYVLPLDFNFPNDPAFEKVYPNALANCCWVHFLRYNQVNRELDFANHDAVRNFILRSDLKGSNEILRKAVAKIYRHINIERNPQLDVKFSEL